MYITTFLYVADQKVFKFYSLVLLSIEANDLTHSCMLIYISMDAVCSISYYYSVSLGSHGKIVMHCAKQGTND